MPAIDRATANITAERIRTAVNQGENTPQLVGGLMRDTVASAVWNNYGLFADLPVSSTVAGDRYFATDAGVLFIWNGTRWVPQGGFVGFQQEITASTDAVTGVLTVNMDLGAGACIILDASVELVLTWTDLPDSDPGLMTSFRLEILCTGSGEITEWNGLWPDDTPPVLVAGKWHLVTGWVSSRANVLRFQAAENYTP